MNKIIIISGIFLILLVSFTLIGILGKHYVCVDNKCEYHYFTLNGLKSSECRSTCKKNEIESEKNKGPLLPCMVGYGEMQNWGNPSAKDYDPTKWKLLQ